ncbi:sulfatase-like hydrolase/transferase [Streptomyces sp. NBC_01613]|uniref:sulfatase-like hydrolase/transferase n=1 Tax=Streptomyces sp. NBC_01613 TaxID=2975896 RepID=UPI0038700F97
MTTVTNARPNSLWIVGEDCPPRFGCYGDQLARTPHLDSLAGRGTLFEYAYSSAPVCAPSRFSLITGIPSESHAPANEMRAVAPLPAWMPTYPEILRGVGHYCTNSSKTDYNAAVDEHTVWNECSPSAHWRDRPEGMPSSRCSTPSRGPESRRRCPPCASRPP